MECLLVCWWRRETGSGAAPWHRGTPRSTPARMRGPVAAQIGWRILPCLRFLNPRHLLYPGCLRRSLLPSLLKYRPPSRNSPRRSHLRWLIPSRQKRWLERAQRQRPDRVPEVGAALRGKDRAAEPAAGPAEVPVAKAERLDHQSRVPWHSRSTLRPRSCEASP
jgi:hypothetical protein